MVARQVARAKAQKGVKETFRLARIVPGWIIGQHEALSGLINPGATVTAVDHCRLHFIAFDTLDEVEKENPLLILNLYKLLSRQEALKSEVTIAQLATMSWLVGALS